MIYSQNMLIEVRNRFPTSYFEEMKANEAVVALMPILTAALLAENQQTFEKSKAD